MAEEIKTEGQKLMDKLSLNRKPSGIFPLRMI